MSILEDDVFNDDIINDDNFTSGNDINPANGLPMDDTGEFDVEGNPFGFDFNDDDFNSGFDDF